MDTKVNSTDVNEKMDAGIDNKPKFHNSLTTAPKSPLVPDESMADQTESLAEATTQISTEDTELSSADISVNVFQNKTIGASVGTNLHDDAKHGVTGAVPIGTPCSVEKDQPKLLCALLPSSKEAGPVYETSRSQGPLKTPTVNTEPDDGGLCAAILLACLFCQPLDCLLATMRGCNECVWSLCSSLCCCEPTALQPLLDIDHHSDVCTCLDIRCFQCEYPACDICLQATECLDLAMEISQMLYH
ncbi:uncharacterized protein LOC115583168 [Sparus aurata]|uniref:uncharacterized protein LOC115583168 n=1 Tax=Sparus aurata TaxID=8175 RepID=UPI0011C14257|nr:uncharacterized protein LOC115583168 [Sparus aurata]